MKAARDDPQRRSQPAGAFFPFSFSPLQLDDPLNIFNQIGQGRIREELFGYIR